MRLLALPCLAMTVASCSTSSEQIVCPAPDTGQSKGTLQESPAQIKAAGDRLGHGSENEIVEVAASLRARHASVTRDEVINYLVTAYCPTVNRQTTLDKAAKRQAVQSFAARAEKIAGAAH